MAVLSALGGSSIGRGMKSESKNRLTPYFGAQGIEEKLRRFLFGWKLMTQGHQKMNAEGCVAGKLPRFVARLNLEAVRSVTLAGGLLRLSLVRRLGRLELLSMTAHFVAIQN